MSTNNAHQVLLFALPTYVFALLLFIAAVVSLTLLIEQARRYARTGERRKAGERMLAVVALIDCGLVVAVLFAALELPVPARSESPAGTWDWVVEWGYGLFSASIIALVFIAGIVTVSVVVWSAREIAANLRGAFLGWKFSDTARFVSRGPSEMPAEAGR